MQTTILGRTGIEVSRFGMGGLGLAPEGEGFVRSRAAVHRAAELGVTYFDTAPGYRDSEEALGKCLEDVSTPVVISTKLGGRPKPFDPQDAAALRGSIEKSLRLLKRDAIDMLLVHEPDRPGQYDWWTDWEDIHGPALDVLAQAKREGLIRFIGLGGTTAYVLARLIESGKFDVVLTAFNYSLLWREAEREIFPAAKEFGLGVIAGSPLQQGWLARRYDDYVNHGAPWLSKPRREQFQALYAFLDEIGMPLPTLALRFVASNPDIHCVLSGSRTVEEVEQNVAAVEAGRLPDDVLQRLHEIAARVPFRPFDEPFGCKFLADYHGPGWPN